MEPFLSADDLDRAAAVVREYGKHQPYFATLATSLIHTLDVTCRHLGVHAQVEGRAKAPESFADKIVRKSGYLQDPLGKTMDLCGLRIITSTLNDLKKVRRHLERETDGFHIDRQNSVVKGQDYRPDQFGYLSVHLVLVLTAKGYPLREIREWFAGREIRVEVQLRTVLQHAWASLEHALNYKNPFTPPRQLQRTLHRVAAVLEDADRTFDRLQDRVEDYARELSSYANSETLLQRKRELGALQWIYPGDPEIAHRLARVAMGLGEWDLVVRVLTRFAETDRAPLQRDLGIALCKIHKDDPDSDQFQLGQSHLEMAIELDDQDIDALAALGGTWRRKESIARERKADSDVVERYAQLAEKYYRRAWQKQPGHSYSLGNYLEYLLLRHGGSRDPDILTFFKPSIEKAVRHCRWQVRARLNLPWAMFDLGKFAMMRRRPYQALHWYAAGIARSNAQWQRETALVSFLTLHGARRLLSGYRWCRKLLQLALATDDPARSSSNAAGETGFLRTPVIVVAGYCGRPLTEEHRRLSLEVLDVFRGTIVGGGTTAGVSGFVGELQERCPDLHTVGYVPDKVPEDVVLDRRYHSHRHSGGKDFSPWEVLHYWSDIINAGVSPKHVCLLCIGGGKMARSECEIALALGARVALVPTADGQPVDQLSKDRLWESDRLRVFQAGQSASTVREFFGL